jgi:hypothetical protein
MSFTLPRRVAKAIVTDYANEIMRNPGRFQVDEWQLTALKVVADRMGWFQLSNRIKKWLNENEQQTSQGETCIR